MSNQFQLQKEADFSTPHCRRAISILRLGTLLSLGIWSLGADLRAQPSRAATSQLRLANFIISDQELTISIGTLGQIKSAGPGTVSGFIPATGPLEIIVRERFSGTLILRDNFQPADSETVTLALLGQPGNRAFPPRLLKLAAGKNRAHTFLNCAPAPATVTVSGTTVATVSDPVPLPPGEPHTITNPPVGQTFTINTNRREKLPAPPLDTAPPNAHLYIFLYRPAPDAPAQLHTTTADSEQIFVREE